jgi:hypothetical protein
MTKAIEKPRADGLTVGHFGLAAERTGVQDLRGTVHTLAIPSTSGLLETSGCVF